MDPDAILAAIEQQRVTDAGPGEERVSYLGFYLGGEVYGLPLEQLREVARVNRVRRVPGAPAGVAGLVNLRGEILCALESGFENWPDAFLFLLKKCLVVSLNGGKKAFTQFFRAAPPIEAALQRLLFQAVVFFSKNL